MKKNNWLFLIALLAYSYLFYQQSAGINFFLFNLLLLAVLLIRNFSLIRFAPFTGFALLSLVSSTGILLYGNLFSVIIHFLCLSVTAGFAVNQNLSLPFAGIQTAFSYCAAPLFAGMDFLERKKERKDRSSIVPKFFLSILVIFVFFLFLFLYRQANPLFKNFTDQINLDFISIGWIFFTLCGAWLLYGFLFPRFMPWFSLFDSQFKNGIANEANPDLHEEHKFQMKTERNSGVLLLSLLNILLLSVHVLDFNFLFITHTLPEGITYSEFVHQGIYTIILSVLFAVGIIVFYFRGYHNFTDKNNTLKILALLWVIQNGILIISGAFKNDLYIHEYSLTYKRIGVYVFLLLSLTGLLFTYLKIIQKKTVWYLLRANAWATFLVLSCMTLINWDRVITQYNLSYSKTLDNYYLLSLSSSVIPELTTLKEKILAKTTPLEGDEMNFVYRLMEKERTFSQRWQEAEWQSWNLDDKRVADFLTNENLKSNSNKSKF